MKGVTLYRDVNENPQTGEEVVNAVAVFDEPDRYWNGRMWMREAIVPTFFRDNSPTTIGSVPVEWLRDAEEISVEEAREIHPKLVERLDLAEEDYWTELNEEMEAMWGEPA